MKAASIRIAEAPFDPALELAEFERGLGDAGAVVSFLGRVRAAAGDQADAVRALYLEHYPGVTERCIKESAAAACARWSLVGARIVHRVGAMAPGEAIVFVGAGAVHRRAAFEAADFLMDYLKTEALFWKKEIRADGAAWIDPRDADYQDAARWKSAGGRNDDARPAKAEV